MLSHRYKFKPRTHTRPKELVAIQPCQVFCWDITYLPSRVAGMFYYLYLVIDIFSRKIVGFTVQPTEDSGNASWLMQDICKAESIEANQLALHADNGRAMKGSTLLATLRRLGVATSFSRPRVSNDNPYAEAIFKTLKYCADYPTTPFDSIEQARDWVSRFVYWYNYEHYHSSLKFITPMQRHLGQADRILNQRKEVYEAAKNKHPYRWSGKTRNWELSQVVVLNPNRNQRRKSDNKSVSNLSASMTT